VESAHLESLLLTSSGIATVAGSASFMVGEDDFDAILGRIRDAGITYYADPFLQKPGAINHLYDGRGVYFRDPDGHVLEAITQPYGPTPA
jgi:catechol 2,3-dioxygenase-like lactoylglutathione lyase family enzyme